MVSQSRHDPTFDSLYPDLGFGLIFRFVGPRRNDGKAVVLGHLLVGGIEIRVVTAGVSAGANPRINAAESCD